MANETIHNAGKLVERILGDARIEADAVLKQAEESCDEVRAQAARERAQMQQAADKQQADAVAAIRDRSRTNAELFARKQALEKRRAVIDRVFEAAYAKLCALSEGERGDVCKKMLLSEAEGGETLVPAKADRAAIDAMLADANKALQQKGLSPATMAKEDAAIAHGFLLRGSGYEKDCSFQALLHDARTGEETNVASILFD